MKRSPRHLMPPQRKVLIDPRGHKELRRLLSDIAVETTLPAGDICIFWGENEKQICLIEAKEVGDLLSSITSGRLYEQASRMSQVSAISFLFILGVLAPTKGGKVRTEGYTTGWNYSSVAGILMSLALRGVIPILASSPFAASLFIRSLVSQFSQEPSPQVKAPKIFHFRDEDKDRLRVVCSLPGINAVLGEALLEHWGSVRNILLVAEQQLQEVHGIGPITARKINEVLDATAPIRTSEGS